MKKSFLLSALLYCGFSTFIVAEAFERKGFIIGLGASVLFPKVEYALPGIEIETGYFFSNQFDMAASLKIALGTAMLSAKGKYYMQDEEDTPYVSVEVGQFVAIRDVDELKLSYAGGIGYAFGHKEVELNVIRDRYSYENDYSSDTHLLVTFRYLF